MEKQEYVSFNGGTDDAALIEDIDPVQQETCKREKIEYIWMVLQCEEFAVNAFIKKHQKMLASKYWYSANLISRVIFQTLT